MPATSDAELLTACHAGDREAYAVLVARHHGLVRTACLRQAPPGEAEDCVQAVFLVLMRRPAAAARAPALAAWLLRVAWYVCRAAQRAARCRRTAEQQAARLTTMPGSSTPEALDHLDDCLARLPERQRAAISLQYLAGKAPDEVATELGVSRENAYQLVSRGLVALRGLLARRGVAVTGAALLSVLAAEGQAAAVCPAAAITLSLSTTPTAGATALAHGACTAMTIATITPLAAAAAAILLPVTAVGVLLAGESAPAPAPPVGPVAAQVVTTTPVSQTVFTTELAGELTLNFQSTPFVDVISAIKRDSKINIVIDPAVMKTIPAPLSLEVTKMRAKNILDFIEEFAGLEHLVKDGAYIIRPAGPKPAAKAVHRVDLLAIDQCPGLADRLAQHITADFQDMKLAEVVTFLRQVTETSVVESPAFRKLSPDQAVTLKVKNMRFDDLLRSICSMSGTTVSARSQALVFDVVPEAEMIAEPVQPAPTPPVGVF